MGNYVCTSFKKELLQGKHDFDAHTFKIALYDSSANFGPDTTDYTATNEVSGVGYTAGGETLTVSSVSTSGTTAYVTFSNLTLSGATITARKAMIYNTTTDGGSNTTEAVCVLDFGSDRSVSGNDFVITFPTGSENIVHIK